jgi:hypothetical protein
MKRSDVIGQMLAMQPELSEDMKNLQNSRNVREEVEEEEEEEEAEQSAQPVSKQTTRAARARPPSTPPINPNLTHGFTFVIGSGHMCHHNLENIVNTNVSNVGNNRSKNYI